MILRQPLSVSLGVERYRPPQHLRLAIAVSAGLHAVALTYVAYTKFNPPPPAEAPQETIYKVPLVDWKKPEPPKPQPRPEKPTVRLHDPVPFPEPPLPLSADPIPNPTPTPPGPLLNFDPPRPPAPPPRDPVIRDPRWVSRPDADEFARFYPERALRMGKEGEATLRCSVAASGQLHDCQVSGETPDNLGFGQAAIKLARYMKIAPRTIDGQPVDGGILVEPIKFRLK